MRKGYRISEKVITNCQLEKNDFVLNTVWNDDNILDEFKPVDGKVEIDGTKLMRSWFPSQESKKVFVSHSHGDLDIVKKFAGYLESKNLETFVDATVWGDSADLISKINHKYNCLPGEEDTFYYSLDHVITSNIYMLLIRALNRMINHCDVFIFIESDNSTQDGNTYSPWIMEELELQNMLAHMIMRKSIDRSMLVEDSTEIRISHDIHVNIEELKPIENERDFNSMKKFIQGAK